MTAKHGLRSGCCPNVGALQGCGVVRVREVTGACPLPSTAASSKSPTEDYEALVDAAEDASDTQAVEAFRQNVDSGDEELIPSYVVDRILDGENRIKVWREHRGLTSKELAEKAGIGQGFLSQIETRKRAGTLDTVRKIAAALKVTIDDLVDEA